MWFVMFLADNEKCPAMVTGLDLNLGLSRVRLCSLKWSFKVIPQKLKLPINSFETFLQCCLKSTLSRKKQNNKNDRSSFPLKRYDRPILPHLIIPVLVLITRIIHRFKLNFAVARNILY